MRRTLISTAAGSVVLGLGFLALSAAGVGCSTAQPKNGTDVGNLPREVRDALDRAGRTYERPLNGAEWTEVSVLTGSEHPIYQVRGTNGRGNKIEAEITRAGRVVEVEERGIALDEVPTAVRERLNAHAPQLKLKQIEAIYQGQDALPVCYGFEGTDGAGKEVEIYISSDGKTILN